MKTFWEDTMVLTTETMILLKQGTEFQNDFLVLMPLRQGWGFKPSQMVSTSNGETTPTP